MNRKSLAFSAVLALGITLEIIPITAQRSGAPPNADPPILSNEQNQAARQRQQEADDLRAIASILSRMDQRQAIEQQRRADEEPKNWGQRLWQRLWNPAVTNWALALFAAIAACIGVRTLRALEKQVRANTRAARAASKSAEATDKTLRLAATTFIDLKGHSVTRNSDDAGQVASLTAAYGIRNFSNNVARNVSVQITYGIRDAMNLTRIVNYAAMSPTKRFFVRAVAPITPDERIALNDGLLWIRMQITIQWVDPLDRTGLRMYHRILRQQPGTNHWTSEALGGAVDSNPDG